MAGRFSNPLTCPYLLISPPVRYSYLSFFATFV